MEAKWGVTAGDWITAALEAMRRGGVEAVAVEAIAVKLGVTKGSFYWHFRDRSDLLEGCFVVGKRRRRALSSPPEHQTSRSTVCSGFLRWSRPTGARSRTPSFLRGPGTIQTSRVEQRRSRASASILFKRSYKRLAFVVLRPLGARRPVISQLWVGSNDPIGATLEALPTTSVSLPMSSSVGCSTISLQNEIRCISAPHAGPRSPMLSKSASRRSLKRMGQHILVALIGFLLSFRLRGRPWQVAESW